MTTTKKKGIREYICATMKRSSYENMPEFGRRLALLRRDRNMRQADLAEALGVTRETISYYESRATNPTAELVQRICGFFDVSPDDLLGSQSEQTPRKRGPASKLERQLEQIRSLPKHQQKAISTVLDMALQNVMQASS